MRVYTVPVKAMMEHIYMKHSHLHERLSVNSNATEEEMVTFFGSEKQREVSLKKAIIYK
ncbi:hypothetical protein ccbrp13_48580 [Ktedonobacteria bacterium brp13]|nr:hypothetical protein ccbrp13_48580 [Ktedonobacteria bacterium brp13]